MGAVMDVASGLDNVQLARVFFWPSIRSTQRQSWRKRVHMYLQAEILTGIVQDNTSGS